MPDRRRILLILGSAATDTHCGNCDALGDDAEGYFCGARHMTLNCDESGAALRAAGCIAAELPTPEPDRPCLTLMPGAKGWSHE